MSNKRRGFYPVAAQEYPAPLIMHHLSNDSLSSTYSWEESVFSEASYGTSQYSPDSTISLPSTPIMKTRTYDSSPTDEATKKVHHITTTIVDEDPSYEFHPPWTTDDYATAAVAPVTPVSQCQQQPQHSQVPGVALCGFNDHQQDDMSEPPLRPDPQNGVHKEHYDFEFTKKDGSFFKLKEECCSLHPQTWPETFPVQPFADPKTGKVRQVCYFEDCPSSFKRHYDLFRHFNTVHGKMSIPCDYKKCGSGIEKAFNRLDHARDHYREYHKEDLVKRSKKDESKAEKADKWRERQPQRDPKNGLWWRCTACLQRNPWNREMKKEEAWRCQEKECHKECELERKIWRLEGVDAVLVYLKLVPGRLPITDKPLDMNPCKPLRRTKRKTEKKIKSESPVSPSAEPTHETHILSRPELCSPSSSKSLKGTDSFRSFSKRMSATTNKEAAITPATAACAPASSTTTADITALEEFSSYYHIATYEDAAPNPSTETIQAQTPAPKTLRRSRGSIAMPEISAPCAALFHPISKGCEFCLCGWRLNENVTACTSCNVDGCICETPPPSEASQASPALSTASQSADENGRSPKRRKTVDDFHPTTPVDNSHGNMDSPPSLQAWDSSSPIHPSLLSLRARTLSEPQEQESLHSSHSHVWVSSPTTVRSSSEVNNYSPTANSELLGFEFKELPTLPLDELEGGDEGAFPDELRVVSQFNDEWDAINYPSSSSL